MKCILIANGDYHFDYIPKGEYVIAVDGGYNYLKEQNIKPNLIVGDLDSCFETCEAIETIKYPKEKDVTDLFIGIKEAINRGYDELIIYGAMGKRIEHTYANINLLHYFNNINIKYIDLNCECFTLNKDDIYKIDEKTGYISIFSLSNSANITITGLKYEVNKETITSNFPLGIDNEAINKKASIKVHDGIILVITRFNN